MLAAAQVLDAIKALLAAHGGTAPDKVFLGRGWALDERELPAWVIVPGDEEIAPQTMHYPALQEHTLNVEATAKVRATQDVDDVMHAFAAQGLAALQGSRDRMALAPLAGVTVRCVGIGRDLVAEGEAAVGALTLRLLVTFRTRQNAPETLV